jgi:hypothetical protein
MESDTPLVCQNRFTRYMDENNIITKSLTNVERSRCYLKCHIVDEYGWSGNNTLINALLNLRNDRWRNNDGGGCMKRYNNNSCRSCCVGCEKLSKMWDYMHYFEFLVLVLTFLISLQLNNYETKIRYLINNILWMSFSIGYVFCLILDLGD